MAYILTTLGGLSLQFQISANLMAVGKAKGLYLGYTIFVSIIGIGTIVGLVFSRNLILAGAYLIVSYLWFLIYYGIQKDWANVLGSIINLVGFGVQQGLDSACGVKGYDVCWQDCPLRHPDVFNHNAIFHVLVFIGLIVQLFARFVPSQLLESVNEQQHEKEIDNKVLSDVDEETVEEGHATTASA